MIGNPRYIMLQPDGYSYGVKAGPSLGGDVELHGGFRNADDAKAYAEWLREEYTDYEYTTVVRIETHTQVVKRPDALDRWNEEELRAPYWTDGPLPPVEDESRGHH